LFIESDKKNQQKYIDNLLYKLFYLYKLYLLYSRIHSEMKKLSATKAPEGIHVGYAMDGLLWTGESLQAPFYEGV